MIIIAFAPKTSKILPKLLCHKLRHCAIITKKQNDFTMYQFVSHKNIKQISLHQRDINILAQHRWIFVRIYHTKSIDKNMYSAWTCVNMVKRAINIKSFWIQTPLALYKHINKQKRPNGRFFISNAF